MEYLAVPVVAWIIAQGTKYIIDSTKAHTFKNTKSFRDSGRMPSAHSATTVSLALIIGLLDGFNTPLFALATIFSALTMYDAVKVRRVVGEHGTLLQKMVAKIVLNDTDLPRVAEGHKPIEVFVGALIGAFVAVIAFIALKG